MASSIKCTAQKASFMQAYDKHIHELLNRALRNNTIQEQKYEKNITFEILSCFAMVLISFLGAPEATM